VKHVENIGDFRIWKKRGFNVDESQRGQWEQTYFVFPFLPGKVIGPQV
jgi:hypothetical protein